MDISLIKSIIAYSFLGTFLGTAINGWLMGYKNYFVCVVQKTLTYAVFIPSIICFIGGIWLITDWSNPLTEIPKNATATLIKSAHGKGGIVLLLIAIYPYIVTALGFFVFINNTVEIFVNKIKCKKSI